MRKQIEVCSSFIKNTSGIRRGETTGMKAGLTFGQQRV